MRVRGEIARAVGPDAYSMFFGEQVNVRIEEDRLVIAAPTRFMASMIERRFARNVRDALNAVPGLKEFGVNICTSEPDPALERSLPSLEAVAVSLPIEAPAARRPASAGRRHPSAPFLSDRYRLEDFIVGESNRLAYDVAVRLAESDPEEGAGENADRAARPCRLLFLHGACGLGKTHLLQGIAHRFKQRRPGAIVRFTTGESFTNDFIATLHGDNGRGSDRGGSPASGMDRFRKQYRRVDLLCIDDVHFLASKSATQTELLHTFNELDLSGATIVIACDEHPRVVKKFSEALVSRFLAGMVAKIETPGRDLCEKLLRRFGERRGLVFDDAALRAVSARIAAVPRAVGAAKTPARRTEADADAGHSIRELEGLVTRIEAGVRLSQNGAASGVCRVTTADVHQILDGLGIAQSSESQDAGGFGRVKRQAVASYDGSVKPVRLESIMVETCRLLGVEYSDLSGSGRHPRVVLARSIIGHLARRLTHMSYPEIARGMGRPSHSTIIAACQRLEKQLAGDLGVNARISGLDLTLAEVCDRLSARLTSGGN